MSCALHDPGTHPGGRACDRGSVMRWVDDDFHRVSTTEGVEVAGNFDCESGGIIEKRDADFIAHSREDVRFLLDRLKAAESRIRELELAGA